MDGQHLERTRAPPSRAASQSSTTGTTRMPSQSALDVGYVGSSPQRTRKQTAHSRSSGSPHPSARSGSRLSRESSGEVIRQAAHSSFLQEKLDRERRSEKAAAQSRLQAETESNAGSTRSSQKSVLGPTDESQRPRSSGGSDGARSKPLPLKEMEHVVSNLQKQNFDLKLEIYHRRERQEKLEARVEALEADRQQMQDVNDKLMEELEKRDKAVEEAVAMIVMLEAKVEQMVEEQADMVRRVEANEPPSPTDREATPKRDQKPSRTMNRMPSFVSDYQEGTENLRAVYLSARGSVISLSRVAEGQTAPSSPTMSLLSQSSFISVYGQKSDEGAADPAGYDGAPEIWGNSIILQAPRAPAQPLDRASPDQGTLHGQAKEVRITRIPPRKSPSRPRTKEEKRRALQKVMTEAPGGARLVDNGLPPTPDTISSSTLGRPDESLSRQNTALSAAAAMVQGLRDRPDATVTPSLEAARRNEHDLVGSKIQRPHSASETTLSCRRGNDWGSDSDDTDARSLESSTDVWMRESATNRFSPDMFGFPSSRTESLQGRGGARIDLDNDQMDDLFSIQNALFASHAPPAPYRKSSLHARTLSSSGTNLQHEPEGAATPVQARFTPTAPPNSEHRRLRYPPASGQLGARIGFRKMFHRAANGAPPEFSLDGAANHLGEDLSSATPPPILRNPRHLRTNSLGVDVAMVDSPKTLSAGPPTQAQAAQAPESAGGRRKWLPGFGRSSSLRNRS